MFGKHKDNDITEEAPSPPEGRITVSFNMDTDIAKALVGVGDEEEQGRFMEKAIAKALIDQKIKEVEKLQAKAKRLV